MTERMDVLLRRYDGTEQVLNITADPYREEPDGCWREIRMDEAGKTLAFEHTGRRDAVGRPVYSQGRAYFWEA